MFRLIPVSGTLINPKDLLSGTLCLKSWKIQVALDSIRGRKEYQDFLRRQFGTLEMGKYSKYLPYVFTEQGVAMLSSVLSSKQAIMVNIQIMRAFVNLKREKLTYVSLKWKIEQMENKYDGQFNIVFEAVKKLLTPPPVKPKPQIGFH